MRTNHFALMWFMSFNKLEGQIVRWIRLLQESNCTSEHRQGRQHKNANALLRRPCQEECTHCHKIDVRAYVKRVRANGCSRTRLESSLSENRRIEQPEYEASFGGCRDLIAPRMKIHRTRQYHVQRATGSH